MLKKEKKKMISHCWYVVFNEVNDKVVFLL